MSPARVLPFARPAPAKKPDATLITERTGHGLTITLPMDVDAIARAVVADVELEPDED